MSAYDLCIVGSGITALSIAYEAQTRGYRVCLLQKKRAGAASIAAAGMLTPMFEVDSAQKPLMSFCVQSAKKYPKWISDIEEQSNISCGYQSNGTLLVALYQDHLSELEQMEAFQRELGLQTERLSKGEVQRREPALASRQVGALWAKDDHCVEPRKLMNALTKIIQQKGGSFYKYEDLQFLKENNHITGCHISDLLTIQGRQYVIAEGAWTTDFDEELPLRPVKGQYLIVKGFPELLNCTIRTPDVYIVPRKQGVYYIGATMEEEGFETHKTAGAALDLLYHTWQIFRGVYEMEIVEHGVGFRPALVDNQPLYDKTSFDNVFVCTGQYRHGVLIAPEGAQLMLNILEGKIRTSPFPKSRFHEK